MEANKTLETSVENKKNKKLKTLDLSLIHI